MSSCLAPPTNHAGTLLSRSPLANIKGARSFVPARIRPVPVAVVPDSPRAPDTVATMVHLAGIPHEEEINQDIVKAVKKVHLQLANDEDCFTTSVYGSKFAAADLPKHEMPEGEMPKDVAYRMIKDDLSLDGNPMLKWVDR